MIDGPMLAGLGMMIIVTAVLLALSLRHHDGVAVKAGKLAVVVMIATSFGYMFAETYRADVTKVTAAMGGRARTGGLTLPR